MIPAYCTNVHPAEDLAGVMAQLDRYAVPVRETLGVDVLPLGLWLSAPVARGLAEKVSARRAFRAELEARGLTATTLNAFPYGGFHDEVVKHAVYLPDWTDPRRGAYTIDCAVVLAALLPDTVPYGSVSTLPLGWREPWGPDEDAVAEAELAAVTDVLRGLDRPVKLAVEPEPGCVLDTVDDAIGWLARHADPEHVGICLDTCHLAVSFADPAAVVTSIDWSGLSVTKVQASAALEVADPGSPEARAALETFAEPRYLHQVRENDPMGVRAADDLPDALADLPAGHPWRVHFHVPLHVEPPAPLASTTGVLLAAMAALRSTVDVLPPVEVETYTWSVMPGGVLDLAEGIAAELRWAADNIGAGVPV